MAVLVTGGLGHVGSWVCHKLAKQGIDVVIGDVTVNNFRQMGLDYLEEVEDRLFLEELDVFNFQSITEVMEKYKNKIEGIIHTVALDPGVHPYKGISYNTFGTLNMVEACRIYGINKFVFTSTGAVYGDTPGPIAEDTPYKATDIYGASKISAELIVLQYGEQFGIDVRCPRLFFVYGPGKLPSRMNGLHKGLFGPLAGITNLTFDKGNDTYADFTHVKDASEGVLKAYSTNTVKHRVFNITCGKAIGVKEIMKVVKEVIGEDPQVSFGKGAWLERGAPLRIERAQEELGFNPEYTNISDGIVDYYNWVQKVPNK